MLIVIFCDSHTCSTHHRMKVLGSTESQACMVLSTTVTNLFWMPVAFIVFFFVMNYACLLFYYSRFYKLHERKCEPIVMTVPRKVSPHPVIILHPDTRSLNWKTRTQRLRVTQSVFSSWVFISFSLWPSSSVWLVPGWLVPRHSWTWTCPGGRRVVWGQERRSHPHLPKEWLCTVKEPWVQGGQKERFGLQGNQEHWELNSCQQDCLFNFECEYLPQ